MTEAVRSARLGLSSGLAMLLVSVAMSSALAQTPTGGAGQIRAIQQAMGDAPSASDLAAAQAQAQAAAWQSKAAGTAAPMPAASSAPAQVPANLQQLARAGVPLPPGRNAAGQVPFGARLFMQTDTPASLPMSDGQHLLAPGDEIRIMIWGGYNYDAALRVQKDGSVFLPFAGVLKVAGLREAELPQVVQRKVSTVFTSSVQSSASLVSANPVRIFVTGYAVAPGIYEGFPGEGAFAFLKRAGGVDPMRGSYTNIQQIRAGKSVAQVDLYELIANGLQAPIGLQSGDTLHVALRGPTVVVRGLVSVESEVEIGAATRTLGQLAALTGADPTATQVRLERVNQGVRRAELVSLQTATWRDMALQPGDAIEFGRSDRTESIYVRINGEHEGGSELVLPKGATLADALALIKPNGWSRPAESFVIREEIRQAQIVFKSMAARQIESTILGARSSSVDEARLRKEEADLLLDWVKRLERYDVRGALVAANSNPAEVFLVSGDVIEIPSSRAPVFVVGDVFTPMAAQQAAGFTTRDYLKLAGVDVERPELRYFIQHPSGVVQSGAGLDSKPGPGDQVFVLPAVDAKKLQGSKDLLQIIYQLAVSSKIIFGL